MTDDRDPGVCPHCNAVLEDAGTEPGQTPYWFCPGCHTAILPPRNLGYAVALIRTRIHEDRLEASTDGCDPFRFLERVCDRLQIVTEGIREQAAERRLEAAGRDSTAAGEQTEIERWSA